MSIVDNDIQIYTAFSEQELRSLRNCLVSDEDMYREAFYATENVVTALRELRVVLNKKTRKEARS